MTMSFLWFGRDMLVRRAEGDDVREWKIKMLDDGGPCLVKAGADVRVGDEVFRMSSFGKAQDETRRVVGHIDWISRRPQKVGVITWRGAAALQVNPIKGGSVDFDIELMAIKLLDWLADRSKVNEFTPIAEFIVAEQLPDMSQWHLREYLMEHGWVNDASGLNAVDVSLTSQGVAEINRIRRRRKDPAERATTLRKYLLNWLYHQEITSSSADWENFLGNTEYTMLGEPFGVDELTRQVAYLKERSLIDGDSVWNAIAGLYYPTLTADGRDCVTEYGGNVSAYLNRQQGGSNTNINVTGVSGQVVVASSNVTQNMASGLDVATILKFAGFVKQTASTLGLTPAEQAELETDAENLHSAASESEPERGRLKQLTDAVMSGLAKATSTVVGSMAIDLGEEALKITG